MTKLTTLDDDDDDGEDDDNDDELINYIMRGPYQLTELSLTDQI